MEGEISALPTLQRPLAPQVYRTYQMNPQGPGPGLYPLNFSHKDQTLGTQTLGPHCKGKLASHLGKTTYHLHASVCEQQHAPPSEQSQEALLAP